MRIYLDNAATTFPKPETVYSAIDDYNRRIGAAVGRGTYSHASEARRIIDRCRTLAAELLGAESPDRIVFTFNGTDSLNLALMGLCRPGDHVISTVMEHNSVLRPLRWLKDHREVELTFVRPDDRGLIEPQDIVSYLRPSTRLIAIQHASNVTGIVQPIEQICEIARRANVLTVVDAAQTAGQWPINLAQLPIDVLACPGHKGLLGPLGTGLLYVRPGVEQRLDCYRLGGTGTQSDDDRQPHSMPDRYESGNHNGPGLAGLAAGLQFLKEKTIAGIQQLEADLTTNLLVGLKQISGVTIYGRPTVAIPAVGVVSLNVAGYSPHEAAAILDEAFAVQVRAGLHCASGVHHHLGTTAMGGTIRLSLGPFLTVDDVKHVIAVIGELAAAV